MDAADFDWLTQTRQIAVEALAEIEKHTIYGTKYGGFQYVFTDDSLMMGNSDAAWAVHELATAALWLIEQQLGVPAAPD